MNSQEATLDTLKASSRTTDSLFECSKRIALSGDWLWYKVPVYEQVMKSAYLSQGTTKDVMEYEASQRSWSFSHAPLAMSLL